MSKNRECTICKHYGKATHAPKDLERCNLFDEAGKAVTISLCRHHCVSLFQLGQRKFLVSHYLILNDLISTEDKEFLELLEKTARNNMDLIA